MTRWEGWYKKKGFRIEPEMPHVYRLVGKVRPRVLDLGCGHGRHVIYFARKGCAVYGIDNYYKAIVGLKRDLGRLGLSANLLVRDFRRKLPYPNGYFDIVVATRSVHHVDSKTVYRIGREISRVMKSRGILFLQVPEYKEQGSAKRSRNRYGKDMGHRWIEPHTYVPLSGLEKGVPHLSFDEEELRGFLRGYRILGLHKETGHYHGYCAIARKVS